jgi:small redox-active disulfide protein 2
MNDVTQIRIGRHLTGIIGWKAAVNEVAARGQGWSDRQIGEALREILSIHNYIEPSVAELYEEAFLREYKRWAGLPVTEPADDVVRIKVLGMGCPQCDRLEQDVMAVMAENGIPAELEHVRDPAAIARYGVMGSPALVINGQVKMVGSVPPKPKIKAWIGEAAQRAKEKS